MGINRMINDVLQKLKELRSVMKKRNIDMYIIPTEDFHSSEYVGDYFKCREYVSGFTGSAGILVMMQNEAGLWTDGRYYLQAEQQLAGTEIDLYKAGMDNVPRIPEYVKKHLKPGMNLGFDGRCLSAFEGYNYKKLIDKIQNSNNSGKIIYQYDLVGEIWEKRPEISKEKAFVLDIQYAGETFESKIKKVRDKMSKKRAEMLLITALDEIAWLLNIRGNDVKCNPVLLSYLIVTNQKVILYCFKDSIQDVQKYLKDLGVEIKDYFDIYHEVEDFEQDTRILMDLDRVNYTLYMSFLKQNLHILNYNNPTLLLKSIKNKIEVENEKKAHLKDAIAYINFLYWFKSNIGKEYMDELTVSERLLNERMKMENFVEESFDPIVAYGEHGAIVHYCATQESKIEIKSNSFLLIDTGAHYLEGTTDITRTLVCKTLTDDEKKHYTAVLRGNLNLGAAKFVYGINGCNLDVLARQPLWNLGLDYNHGTGHGVGYLLNVHENPNNIRWKISEGKRRTPRLEEGMITSNEPGVYIKGKYGIRLENMIVCKKSEDYNTNPFGHFMEFETLTLVPFEREAIIVKDLMENERKLLNAYHAQVYEKVSPYLQKEQKDFLRQYTLAL